LRGLCDTLNAIAGRTAGRGDGDREAAEPEEKLTLERPVAESGGGATTSMEQPPGEQIESGPSSWPKHEALTAGAAIPRDPTLYQQILDWKKSAGEGRISLRGMRRRSSTTFLVFQAIPTRWPTFAAHLRRFIATMQRIPPPQKTSDRLLELGSSLHIAPAIRRLLRLSDGHYADFRETEERIIEKRRSSGRMAGSG
jgi:hypothetical protein